LTPGKRLFSKLSEVVPGTYLAYRPNEVPPLPWFVYSRRNGEEFFADDTNYARLPRYRVELYFRENDPELVESFEAALSELGTWRLYSADYIDSESCLMHDYRLSLNPNK